MVDYIQQIPVLQQSYVHIKNPEKVNNLISGLIEDGFDKLQIVSDFDLTLTKQHVKGQKYYSSFKMFQQCPSVTVSYVEEVEKLMAYYYPIEFDPTVPLDQKAKLMEEWWSKSANALKGLKVSLEELDECVTKLQAPLRDGTDSLFKLLESKNVPVLVFSAGLGDSVVSVLKHYKILCDNVKVISNFLKYDEEGTIQGLAEPLIHVLNKNEYAIKDSPYSNLIKNRNNVIVMGDAVGDSKMADGISDSKHVLKIGFLYEQISENLDLYRDNFDIVLVDDQTMNVINSIIHLFA